MRMTTTTAFRAYTNIRARQTIERIAATARFMVKSVNKDGSISRAADRRRQRFLSAHPPAHGLCETLVALPGACSG